jgi:gliding motility-associated-like protein
MSRTATFLKTIFFPLLFLCSFVKAQNPVPDFTFGPNNACAGTVVNFQGSATGTPTSFAWTCSPAAGVTFTAPASTNTNATFTTGGTYNVTLTVQPGGGTVTKTVTVKSIPVITVTAGKDTICKGSNTTLTASSTLTSTTYSWSPSAGLNSITSANVIASPTVTVTYTVIGTTNGCAGTPVTKQLTVLNTTPAVATSNNYYPCLTSSAVLTASPVGAIAYQWSPTINLSCYNCQSPTFTPTGQGVQIYTLTVTGKCITPATDTVKITSVNCVPPTPVIQQYDHDICRLDCIQFMDSSYYPPLQYLWTFEGGSPTTSTEQNPTVCYNIESSQAPGGTGYFYVDLRVINTVQDTAYLHDSIRVLPSPLANINAGAVSTTIQTGDAVSLNASSYTSGATSYSWTPALDLSCTDCGITEASPLQTTMYIVEATNSVGCSDYDSILVRVSLKCGEVFVPNAFSPNGDGKNDVLRVKNNCFLQVLFRIYNRWGELVFQTEDPNVGWDGTYKGSPLDAGVFVYFVEGVLSDKTTIDKKGNVTLIR